MKNQKKRIIRLSQNTVNPQAIQGGTRRMELDHIWAGSSPYPGG